MRFTLRFAAALAAARGLSFASDIEAIRGCSMFIVTVPTPVDELGPGEVGYLIAGIKDVAEARSGETVTSVRNGAEAPLAGYQEPKAMVFCGLYPVDGDDFADLRGGLGAGVNGSLHGGDIAAEEPAHVAAADRLVARHRDAGGLEGRVSGLEERAESLGFNQTDCFLSHGSEKLSLGWRRVARLRRRSTSRARRAGGR